MKFDKHDEGKPRLNLIPNGSMAECAAAMAVGADKYGEGNWATCKPTDEHRYISALMRHTEAYRSGEITDPDSGVSHLGHILANASILAGLANNRATGAKQPKGKGGT